MDVAKDYRKMLIFAYITLLKIDKMDKALIGERRERDGFIWKYVTLTQAEKLIKYDIMEVYALYDDGTEALVDSLIKLDNLIEEGSRTRDMVFAIEVGII